MIKAVLFDFDGVLTSDATGSMSICNYISQTTGIAYEFFKNAYKKYNDDLLYGKTTHEAIWHQLCGDIGVLIPIRTLYDSFINTPIDDDMLHLIYELKHRNYKIGMITDNKADRIHAVVEYCKWQELFDIITVSADYGSGKDSTGIFIHTIGKLKLAADECVFIDNTEKNLIAPKSLGMNTVFFNHQQRDINKLVNQLRFMDITI